MGNSVLVTGGAGYVGSHVSRELARSGYHPVVLDNLSTGNRGAVDELDLRIGELGDENFLNGLFEEFSFHSVLHFASRSLVFESVRNPQLYFEQNVGNTLTLLRVMLRHRVRRLVFSSSCAIYGLPQEIPLTEEHPQEPVSPYGQTKYLVERMLMEYDRAYGLRFVSLRYFNAAGASLDGFIGEAHHPETHLIPLVLQAALGKQPCIEVFGEDYPTEDGTCIRDFIHVEDLAAAHLQATRWLGSGGCSESFNLGSGRGHSVSKVIEKAREITERQIPVRSSSRRIGDAPILVADAGRACRSLGWKPRYSDLETILKTAWQWEQNRRY